MLKGVIFDFDGTLGDTTWIWKKAVGELILEKGRRCDEEWLFATAHMGPREIACYLIDRYGIADTPEAVVERLDRRMHALYLKEATLKDGGLELLELLREKGIKMCVATATERLLVRAVLERCGALAFLEEVLSCQDIGCSKQQPDVYLAACARLGTHPGNTVVLEDMLFAARTARRAGFWLIGVEDDISATQEHRRALRALADRYVKTPRELVQDRAWLAQMG